VVGGIDQAHFDDGLAACGGDPERLPADAVVEVVRESGGEEVEAAMRGGVVALEGQVSGEAFGENVPIPGVLEGGHGLTDFPGEAVVVARGTMLGDGDGDGYQFVRELSSHGVSHA
jgi:hypothetical protein